MVRWTMAKNFDVPADKVIVHTTFLGGSYGRKYVPDFVLHAAVASKAVGRPVKVIRSREDDIRHGYYRPCASARFRAVLGKDGYPVAMHARVVGESLYAMIKPKAMAAAGGWDETMLDSIYDLAYAVPNLTVDNLDVKQPIPVSFMRSVGSTSAVFFLESFINELADAAGIDPYQYRRRMLSHDPHAIAVLDRVAEASGWNKPPRKGIYRGLAFNLYTGRGGAFKTYVAHVVEVEIVKGAPAVRRVVCARRRRNDHQPRAGEGQHRGRHRLCPDQYPQKRNNFCEWGRRAEQFSRLSAAWPLRDAEYRGCSDRERSAAARLRRGVSGAGRSRGRTCHLSRNQGALEVDAVQAANELDAGTGDIASTSTIRRSIVLAIG